MERQEKPNNKPIILPKDFDGQGSIQIGEWLHEFETLAVLNQWDNAQKLQFLPAF